MPDGYVTLWTRLRWWIDERIDAKRDAWDGGSGSKWRWWVAVQVDRLRGQCWADLADFGLGRTYIPWEPRRPTCVEDAQRCGTCYCGKVARADVPPWPDGPRSRVIVPVPAPAASGDEAVRDA
jgi:hypothetical protein